MSLREVRARRSCGYALLAVTLAAWVAALVLLLVEKPTCDDVIRGDYRNWLYVLALALVLLPAAGLVAWAQSRARRYAFGLLLIGAVGFFVLARTTGDLICPT